MNISKEGSKKYVICLHYPFTRYKRDADPGLKLCNTSTMIKLTTKNDLHDVVSTKIIIFAISGCLHRHCCS